MVLRSSIVNLFCFTLRNQKTADATNNAPKQTQAKQTAKQQQSGRKSRKSQPKRNFRHTALDSDDDAGGPSTQDTSGASWRERSVSSIDETEVSARDTREMDASFDLSKVKHEVDLDEEHMRAKQNDKGKLKS